MFLVEILKRIIYWKGADRIGRISVIYFKDYILSQQFFSCHLIIGYADYKNC